MEADLLSQEEVYQIAFLAIRGWVCQNNKWFKKGRIRSLTVEEQEYNVRYKPYYSGKDFRRDQAYDNELYNDCCQFPLLATNTVYNTGDQVLSIDLDGKQIVLKIKTNDGIKWQIGDTNLTMQK